MQTLERYGSAPAYAPTEQLTHDERRQATCPVPPAERSTPIEQSNDTDPDERYICLSAIAQYLRETRQITRMSPEAEQLTVAQARQGDHAAKQRLIVDRLPYITYMAMQYHVYAEHEDLLDIIGVGSLAVTASIDKALAKQVPAAYLHGVARREIRSYCFYHSRLIPIKDHRMPRTEAPCTIPLDEQHDEVPCPDQASPTSSDTPETSTATHEQLRHALDHLPEQERQVVELRHGFQGTGDGCGFTDIARMLALPRATVYRRYERGMARLRELAGTNIPVSG